MHKYDTSHNFELITDFTPKGDQPFAIQQLVNGIKENKKIQVLQGATGTGKTFTMANVIVQVQKPTIIIVHNKTLANQLYSELKTLFPKNRVEYFISNFDFYRPEAYLPKTDTYIEKEVLSNDEIEMMRASAVNSILERKDTIVVCSVASIYSLTDPNEYKNLVFDLRVGETFDRKKVGKKLIESQYDRNDLAREKGTFSIRGDTIEIRPCSTEDTTIRITLDFDKIESIEEIDNTTGEFIRSYKSYQIYPAYEHTNSFETIAPAIKTIREELYERLDYFKENNKLLEYERLKQRTFFDIANLEEYGFCSGMENYSRHFDHRKPGETPYTIFDYFQEDFLLFIDESHVTIPQIKSMYFADRKRKETLIEYGFRLPSAIDNRPLNFNEFQSKIKNLICTSATPGPYELNETNNEIIEQIIRPTGLLDPTIEVRSQENNPIYDLLEEIKKNNKNNQRTLVLTLTIKDAENLYHFYKEKGIKCYYIQHEVKTLERTEIIYKLRKGIYDVLIGINLLREGLDIPEVSLIAILDADKEGFLRSQRSLIQIVGRAARNENGHVIMYANTITDSMNACIKETKRRRTIQEEYNRKNNITPKTIQKKLIEPIRLVNEISPDYTNINKEAKMSKTEIKNLIASLTKEMNKAAKDMDFEKAAQFRDMIIEIKSQQE